MVRVLVVQPNPFGSRSPPGDPRAEDPRHRHREGCSAGALGDVKGGRGDRHRSGHGRFLGDLCHVGHMGFVGHMGVAYGCCDLFLVGHFSLQLLGMAARAVSSFAG